MVCMGSIVMVYCCGRLWVDNYLCVERKIKVNIARKKILRRFECDDVGEVTEYMGCRVKIN